MSLLLKAECSKCGELVEVAGRTVVAPFVCEECKEADGFQEKISPNPDRTKFLRTASGVAAAFTPSPIQDIVENASTIITDLERQAQVSNDLISDLSTQNLKLVDDYNALASLARAVKEQSDVVLAKVGALAEENTFLKSQFDEMNLNKIKRDIFRDGYIEFLKQSRDKWYRRAEWAKSLAHAATTEIHFWKSQSKSWELSWRKVNDKNLALNERGFWARVFDLRP